MTTRGEFADRIAILFLKGVVLLIGLGALAFLVLEPQVEGRNAHATQFQIYFSDPFLAYGYTASIAFFVALVQAFRLLGYAGQGMAASPAGARALRTIKLCALAMIGFVVAGEFLFILFNTSDDRAGGVMMGNFIILVSATTAAAAQVLERLVRGAKA